MPKTMKVNAKKKWCKHIIIKYDKDMDIRFYCYFGSLNYKCEHWNYCAVCGAKKPSQTV